MTWISVAAMFFIIWWLVLFATLPFTLRTQDDDADVTLGTVSSAPGGPHMLRAVLRTTLVAVIICAMFYGATRLLGWSLDDLPQFVPETFG